MKKNLPKILLGIFITFYIVIFSYLSVKRHQTLHTHYYDLGIMDQVVYNTSKGHFLEMSNQELKKNANRMAIHFDPILAIFAPIYKIYPAPEILLISQTILFGLGALAVYLISEKILKDNKLSLLFAGLYLLYFPVQRANLFDFHAVTMATPLLLFAIYFNLTKRDTPFFIFIILALLTKEHVGLVVFLYGLYLILKKQKKIGLITALLGISAFIFSVYFIIPYFRKETHFALKYFTSLGDQPTKVIFNIFRHPRLTLVYLFSKDTLNYASRMILPTFYSLFSPLTFLIAVPEWAINIFSSNANMRAIYYQYNSLIVPIIFYSLILGYKNFNKIVKNKFIRAIVFILFISLNIRSVYLYNPIPAFFVKQPMSLPLPSKKKIESINLWKKNLKDDNIKVSTTPGIAPYFTQRRYYISFLYDPAFYEMGYTEDDIIKAKAGAYKEANYVIINKDEIGSLKNDNLPVKFYKYLKQDKSFKMIYYDGEDIEVYKKI